MYNILVCDDESDIISALRIYLASEGYKVISARNGEEALLAAKENEIHLVLMDIMMPRMDGLTATAMLRECSNIPVILLTAKSEDADKIIGLNLGADDYITKPFNPAELLARVKSHLRRYTRLGGITEAAAKPDARLKNGGIELDDEKKEVLCDGEPIVLTPLEYEILKFFMQNPGKVFSSAEIYRRVWNDAAMGFEGTVAVHIRHLREKIEINPTEPRYIKVVWGHGYKMTEDK